MPNALVDTNILVYAACEVQPLPHKSRIAQALLLQKELCLSIQVLNEFTANVRAHHKLNLSPPREEKWPGQMLQ